MENEWKMNGNIWQDVGPETFNFFQFTFKFHSISFQVPFKLHKINWMELNWIKLNLNETWIESHSIFFQFPLNFDLNIIQIQFKFQSNTFQFSFNFYSIEINGNLSGLKNANESTHILCNENVNSEIIGLFVLNNWLFVCPK